MKAAKDRPSLLLRFTKVAPHILRETEFRLNGESEPIKKNTIGNKQDKPDFPWGKSAMSLFHCLISYAANPCEDDQPYVHPANETDVFDTLCETLSSPGKLNAVFGQIQDESGMMRNVLTATIFDAPNPSLNRLVKISSPVNIEVWFCKKSKKDKDGEWQDGCRVTGRKALDELAANIVVQFKACRTKGRHLAKGADDSLLQTPTTPGPQWPTGDAANTAVVEGTVVSEAAIRAVIKSLVAENSSVLTGDRKETPSVPHELSIPQADEQNVRNDEHAIKSITAISKTVADKPDFGPFLRSVIDEFTDLPVLPGGIKNLALCDIINLKVQFPPPSAGLSSEKEASLRIRNLAEAVEEERAWLLIGEGGQGKSTALRFLAHHFAKEQLVAHDAPSSVARKKDGLIPLHLTLSRHAETLINQIHDTLLHFGFPSTIESLWDLLRSESFLFLFDRLDETDPHVMVDEINDLLRMAPNSRLVVASRPSALLSKWPLPQARLQPLTNSDIRRLLIKLTGEDSGAEMFDALIRHRSLDAFRRPLFARLLALTSLALTNQEHFTIGQVFREVLEKLFFGSWEINSESRIDFKLATEVLASLGHLMLATDRQSVKREIALRLGIELARKRDDQAGVRSVERVIERLLKQGLLQAIGDELQFWHTNFRDYFAAVWMEHHMSRTAIYFKSWQPRWHEALIFLCGILEQDRLAVEMKSLLFGAGLTIKSLSFVPPDGFLRRLFFIPYLFLYLPLQGAGQRLIASRLFFLIRMLAQSGPEHTEAKKRLVRALPKRFSYFYLQGPTVPVVYDFSHRGGKYGRGGEEYFYFCDLIGHLRIPEAIEYLKTVQTDFPNVAPGLFQEPDEDIVDETIAYLTADFSVNGRMSNPRGTGHFLVAWFALSSSHPRLLLKLKEMLAGNDVRVRSRLLRTLSEALQLYRNVVEPDLFLELQARWTPTLVDLALHDVEETVRSYASKMLKALVNNFDVPSQALPPLLEALQSGDHEIRYRALSAISENQLVQYPTICWRLLGDSNISIVLRTIFLYEVFGRDRFPSAVLKALRCYSRRDIEWKRHAADIAIQLREVEPEKQLPRRCLGLLLCALSDGPYNGFILSSLRVINSFRLKWTLSLLVEIFHGNNWVRIRIEALDGLVDILGNQSRQFVLEALRDHDEDMRLYAVHLADKDYFDFEFHKVVGPILFDLLKDPSEHVQRAAARNLAELGFLDKDWHSLRDGEPIYLGPPASSG